MLALGVDPGTAICGYGLVEIQGSRLKPIDFGAIETGTNLSPADRLRIIYQEMNGIITRYKPEVIGVERLFFNKNIKTAMAVSEARGVVMLAAAQNNLIIVEFTPLEVKQSVVGYGKATKEQVIFMTQKLLNLSAKPKPDDAADALAIAICTLHSNINRMWKIES